MNANLIKTLSQQAQSQISADLSLQDSSSVVTEFERLLNAALEVVYLTPSPKNDEIAQRVGQSLIKKVSQVPPQTRLEFIQNELIEQEVRNLNMTAWKIAQQWIAKSPNRPALQAQAKTVYENTQQLYNLLDQMGTSWRDRYNRSLAEALSDCRYVLGLSQHSSLRLGRLLKILTRTIRNY